MAAQIRRDLYADVTSRKRPAEAMQSLDWPTQHGGDRWSRVNATYHAPPRNTGST
jgi:hypothetical protein